MVRQSILACFSALALCASASPAQGPIADRGLSASATGAGTQILPMRYYGTRPAVEVRVNGRGPFLFLIDTGASGDARADSSLVRQLGLRSPGRARASDAGGAAAEIDRITFDSIEVGAFRATGVEALARDYNGTSYLPRIDGILGFDFFRGILLTLDNARGEVRLERGALPPADGRTVLDYTLVEGQPALTVRIGARSFQVLLDTGNIRALDLPSAWLRAMPLAGFPRLAGSSSSVSGTVGLREVSLAEPLIIGRYRFENPAVTFADEFHEANLGSTILRTFTVTIDQQNRRVRLVAIPGRNPFR
jgi:hypothetical protein